MRDPGITSGNLINNLNIDLRTPICRSQPSPAWQAPLGPGGGWDLLRWQTARFDLILLKLRQNGVVSPEYVEKACHSPCFQNGRVKSPLEILRFPFSRAFSHKELMGHFDGCAGLYVKMTKCRQVCTLRYAKGSVPAASGPPRVAGPAPCGRCPAPGPQREQ